MIPVGTSVNPGELGCGPKVGENIYFISLTTHIVPYSLHQQLPYLNINTIKVVTDDYRNDYHHYINQVLNVLELACIAFVNDPGNVDVMSTNHPAITQSNAVPHFIYNKNHEIDMPGVYWGCTMLTLKGGRTEGLFLTCTIFIKQSFKI